MYVPASIELKRFVQSVADCFVRSEEVADLKINEFEELQAEAAAAQQEILDQKAEIEEQQRRFDEKQQELQNMEQEKKGAEAARVAAELEREREKLQRERNEANVRELEKAQAINRKLAPHGFYMNCRVKAKGNVVWCSNGQKVCDDGHPGIIKGAGDDGRANVDWDCGA